jgi:hypothetical protein
MNTKRIFYYCLCLVILLSMCTIPANAEVSLDVQSPDAPGDQFWSDKFKRNGIEPDSDYLYATAVDASGNLYVGGWFENIGGIPANNIAMWDGSAWHDLDGGMDSSVYALYVDGNGNLYVGGSFTQAGGIAANRIAKWNGTSWSTLGSGMSGGYLQVTCLTMDSGGNLYAGGEFTNAGGVAAKNVAKWNGTAWSAMGSGLSYTPTPTDYHPVMALAADGTTIYAGGDFNRSGATVVNYIAKWTGSAWVTVGTNGMNSIVFALLVDNSHNLFAGGDFTTAGGIAANSIAKWNGSAWSPLGSGVEYYEILSLGFDATTGDLYAGGNFENAGGVSAMYIAKYSGGSWSALGNGMNDEVYALSVVNSTLVYAGGYFFQAGDVAANGIAAWDGSDWAYLGEDNAFNDEIYALVKDSDGDIIAGGEFTIAGGQSITGTARWDGDHWSDLDGGVDDPYVWALAVHNDTVYVGGSFDMAGSTPVSYIAKWESGVWSDLGSGVNGSVDALAIDSNGILYAAGSFDTAGGVSVGKLARWDGSNWSDLGTGFSWGDSNFIFALTVDDDNNLYVGGSFSTIGGISTKGIAKYTPGTVAGSWSAVGGGLTGTGSIQALLFDEGVLYIGGGFSSVGNIPAINIARWNGSSWSALGSGLNDFVFSIAIDEEGRLYAAGYFNSPNKIARWTGANWVALGSGLDGGGYTLLADGEDIYVGGNFNTAGDKPSYYFAWWSPDIFDVFLPLILK